MGGLPESETIYNAKLSVVSDLGNVTVTNKIRFRFPDIADPADPTRHYTAKIHCDGTYTPSSNNFDTAVNIRDVINNDGEYVNLPGVMNCPSGTVYGTVEVNPKFNRLVSSKSGTGTGSNSFDGSVIFNYQDNTNIAANADMGNYISGYVVTRTDNTGGVSVVTNNLPDQSLTTTNLDFLNIMGSNAVNVTYMPMLEQIVSTAGAGGTINPAGTNNLPYNSFTNFIINANQPSNRISFIKQDGTVVYTNSTGNNSMVSTNVNYGPVTNNGSMEVGSELKTFSLAVNSGGHGIPTPSGTTTNTYGTLESAVIAGSPIVNGGTQYVANGASMLGNDYITNSLTDVSFIQTNNAVLNWLWKTQYMFNASASTNGTGRGSVTGGNSNGFYDAASVLSKTAVANGDSYFSGWLGTENSKSNPVSITMNAPKTEEAVFKARPGFSDVKNEHSADLYFNNLDVGQNYNVMSATNLLEASLNGQYKTNFTADATTATISVNENTNSPAEFFWLEFNPN